MSYAVNKQKLLPEIDETMLVEDLASLPAGSRFEADILIIGGGKAGLTMAREFMNSTTKVLILESGLGFENVDHMELNRVESLDEPTGEATVAFRKVFHGANMATYDAELQPYGIRCRMLGGCPYWGGKSATFDEIDFAKRDWVPFSGWPITRESLEPYFKRAADVLNLGPNLYGEELWPVIGTKVKRPPIDKSKLHSFFWQFARSRLKHTEIMNLADEFVVENSANIRTLTNATVVHIDTDATGAQFRGVEISTLGGVRSYATGRFCVLSAGGIENARLLLISNRQHPSGLGNAHDVVGRYLMDHPGTRIGYFKKEDVKAANYLGFYTIAHDRGFVMYMHGLSFGPDFQREQKLLNAAIYPLPEIALNDPIEALKRLAKLKSVEPLADILSLVGSAGLLLKGLALKVFYHKWFPALLQRLIVEFFMWINPGLVVREFQSKGVPHKLDRMAIHVMTEQQPNPDSRLTLSDKTDVLGLPMVRAHWKISEADRKNVMRIAQLVSEELPKAGLPAPVMADWVTEDHPEDAPLVDMAHMIGTTRMSDDPKFGVVDSRCEVHGVKGLYIAGSSVFPTSGHANPTLMILTLAIRAADELKRQLVPDAATVATTTQKKAALESL